MSYDDPIIKLIQDPNLNKDKNKTSQLIRLINGFPLTERKVSKLCQSSFSILQTLEKFKLTFKSWEFLSLDYNSDSHFNTVDNDHDIKTFNNGIAAKVLKTCNELNVKVNKVSIDLDFITKASRTLTPMEYISDSGTLLTSLLLRSIKLKNEVVDNLTVAYLKAKLISIGKELEIMLNNSNGVDEESDLTVLTYKTFIINLLKQLNNSIENEDNEAKYESLAVINDMEKMFDAFKLEKAREQAVSIYKEEVEQEIQQEIQLDLDNKIDDDYLDLEETPKSKAIPTPGPRNRGSRRGAPSRVPSPKMNLQNLATPTSDDDYDYSDSDYGSNSLYSSSFGGAMVHSITKSNSNLQKPSSPKLHRKDSLSTLSTSTMLHKTTLSEELPYLMTAFSSARNFEEDVNHFKEEDQKSHKKDQKPRRSPPTEHVEAKKEKQFYSHKTNLPDSSLYSESIVLPKPSAASYLYSNNSLLAKLGIRPQVITAELPKELGISARANGTYSPKKYIKVDDDESNKENKQIPGLALTKENLESHTLAVDYVE